MKKDSNEIILQISTTMHQLDNQINSWPQQSHWYSKEKLDVFKNKAADMKTGIFFDALWVNDCKSVKNGKIILNENMILVKTIG